MQLRKLEKDRLSFICEKKNAAVKRDRLIETLKKEKLQLQDRLDAISTGPHAQRELKVSLQIFKSFLTLKLLHPFNVRKMNVVHLVGVV